MKKIVNWFNSIERAIFGRKINSNSYFATMSLMFVAFLGALLGCKEFLPEWEFLMYYMDLDVSPRGFNGITFCAIAVVLLTMNIAESIAAAENPGVAAGRAGLVTGAFIAVMLMGYLTSVLMLVTIVVWIVLLLVSFCLPSTYRDTECDVI